MVSVTALSQKVSVQPTITPETIDPGKEMTISYDVTGTTLADLDEAWLWLWLPDLSNVDVPTNVNPASSNSTLTDQAKFSKSVDGTTTTFSITITLTEFTNKPASEIKKVGMLIKGNDWSDGQSTDFIIELVPNTSGIHAVDPTISPDFPKADEEITINYDVTGTPLEFLEEAWLWFWLPELEGYEVPTNINPASDNPSVSDKAKFTKETVEGRTIFTITVTPVDFTNRSAEEINKVGVLIKGNDWSDGQSTDFIIEILEGFALKIVSPAASRAVYTEGDIVEIDARTPEPATFVLTIDDMVQAEEINISTFTYSHPVIVDGNEHTIKITASTSTEEKTFTHTYITPIVVEEAVPDGMIDGINYHSDPSTATLVLTAPNKENVFVLGDFNDWTFDQDYVMKKDGHKFWLTLDGLTIHQEYLYQYLIDGEILIADPYSEKISSSFDDPQIIEENRYPGLRSFPSEFTEFEATYLQTAQSEYQWEVENFEKPDKEDLVIYELLVRDFTGDRTYNAVIDRLDYLDSLGINAIELLPVTEYEGNISWGYNPSYKLAPDKFYGTENELKKLIDEAHKRGIAIIFDMVLNHHFGRSPLVRMEASGEFGPPTEDNVWFNVNPKHDFNVGYDFNHESQFTKDYVDRVVTYWTEKYKVDGYRFDLSKGFTQTNSLGDVGFWGQYDITRVNLLKRMADVIWEQDPGTYVILEHLAENSEERDLANAGMMLWGNMREAFRGIARGQTPNIDWLYHGTRGWNDPHIVGYMESHDEERIAWTQRNLNISFKTKMNRLQLNAVFFFMVPGPKMLWQFGEMGYDEELNNDRLGIKPTHWEYLDDPHRRRLFDVYQAMISLKTNTDYVSDDFFSWEPAGSIKWINHEHPAVQISIFGNFSMDYITGDPHFVSAGDWYDYFTGEMITVSDPNEHVELAPGEFHVYTSEPIDNYISTNPIDFATGGLSVDHTVTIYPNPSFNDFKIHSEVPVTRVRIIDMLGRVVSVVKYEEPVKSVLMESRLLVPGIYVIEIQNIKEQIIKDLLIRSDGEFAR